MENNPEYMKGNEGTYNIQKPGNSTIKDYTVEVGTEENKKVSDSDLEKRMRMFMSGGDPNNPECKINEGR